MTEHAAETIQREPVPPSYERLAFTIPNDIDDELFTILHPTDEREDIKKKLEEEGFNLADIPQMVNGELQERIYHRREDVARVLGVINVAMKLDVDTLVFLDKSERPYGYNVLSAWNSIETYYKKQGKTIKPCPQIRFRNIGRETQPENIPKEIEDSIIEAGKGSFYDVDTEGVKKGKRILIVDDIVHEGKTLRSTQTIVSSLFPESTCYFMTTGEGSWLRLQSTDNPQLGIRDYRQKDAMREQELTAEEADKKYLGGHITMRYGKPIDPNLSGWRREEAKEKRRVISDAVYALRKGNFSFFPNLVPLLQEQSLELVTLPKPLYEP